MPIRLHPVLAMMLAVPLLLIAQRLVAQPADDVRLACDQAATRAEQTWSLPPGVLVAIGTVESGRTDASGLYRRAWPWTINADGAGYFASSKDEAVNLVRTLQARGARYIDVGCFQVDLFYHPDAFSSLEQAFDPDANARAAAHILMQGRLAATAWEPAIAAYHSASLLKGAWYLQQVQAAWSGAPRPLAMPAVGPSQRPGYAILLSPAARLVRVITVSDPSSMPLAGLPRVFSPSGMSGQPRPIGPAGLPRVLTPAEAFPRQIGRL
jgi:hypothetical protein